VFTKNHCNLNHFCNQWKPLSRTGRIIIMSSARRSEDYVDSPEPADVLFGRGSGPNDHDGNILFRSLVKERKADYMATNHRQTKANIANEVVNAIRAQNGRFLKKADGRDLKRLGLSPDSEVWCFVDEKHILEKAKQALRQKGDMKDQDDAKAPARPDKKAASAAGVSSATKKSAPPPVPSEAVSYYGHEHRCPLLLCQRCTAQATCP
jgi:hypothetical protein